jgi:hypothetical protein
MNLFIFALRNLQRRRIRTILTMAGIALAVAVLFSPYWHSRLDMNRNL